MSFKTDDSFTTLKRVQDILRTHKRAFYVRYGDADAYHMEMRKTRNHPVPREKMANELKEGIAIYDTEYMIAVAANYPNDKGMEKGLFATFGNNEWLAKVFQKYDPHFQKRINQENYYNPVAFLYFSVFYPQVLNDFLDEFVRPKKKLFIGGTPTEPSERLYGPILHYVKTPSKDAYSAIEKTWEAIKPLLDDVELIIPSMGQASRAISKRLWYHGYDRHLLDLGSIVDAACNLQTRTWIKMKGKTIQKCLINKDKINEYRSRW